MTTLTDAFGRTVTVESGPTSDTYAVDGMVLSYPAGTPQAVALDALGGMAPDGWAPQAAPAPVPDSVPNASARIVLQRQFAPDERSFYTIVDSFLRQQRDATAELPDNDPQKLGALEYWTRWDMGNFFERAHPMLEAMADVIRASGGEVDIDALFIEAAGI